MKDILSQTYSAVQSQKAVSAYFTSKQILPFGFAEQYCSLDVSEYYLPVEKVADLSAALVRDIPTNTDIETMLI